MSIRQKILLAVMVPAVLFYLLVTVVCLYFSYYSVTTEVRGRYIEEALYASAVIDANVRELIFIGHLIEQAVRSYGYIDQSNILGILRAKLEKSDVVSGVGFYNPKIGVQEAVYWELKDGGALRTTYINSVSSLLLNKVSSLALENKVGFDWYTDPSSKPLEAFRSSLIISVITNTGKEIIHIDLDGDKLASYWDFKEKNIFLKNGSSFSENKKTREPINSRLHFCKRFTLRDAEGVTVYSTGRSAKYYRKLSEKVVKMTPINGASEFLSYEELNNQSFLEFISENRIKPIVSDNPNKILLDLFNRSYETGDIIHFRFSIRDDWKIWCTVIPIKSLGWVLNAYMPEKDILHPVYNQLIVCLLLSISAVFIALISLWVIAGRISNPLRKLKDDMNLYSKKIEPRAIFQDSKNEVVSLGRSFNQLVKCVDDRDKALNEARATNISHLANQLHGSYFYFNLDCNGNITYVSPSVNSVLGYKKKNFIGKFRKYLTSAAVNKKFNDMVMRIFKGSWSDAFEVEMLHCDGSVRRVELFCCLVSGIMPQKRTIEGVANDITEHIVDTEKFKSLIASSPDATVITNSDGIICIANKRVYELFEYSPDVLINMPISIIIPTSDRDDLSLISAFKSGVLDRQHLSSWECLGIKKGGGIFSIDMASSVINTNQECLVSIVIRDISERKKIENELLAAKEKAEQSDRAKMLFLSNMSHELRTPLNGVLGYSQILIGDKTLTVGHKSKVKSIEECGRHLLTLINDILDVAKIESGYIKIDSKPFSIKTVIDKVLSIVRNSAVEKGLHLVIDVNDDVPTYLIGDKLKLRQVLINLLGNAIKFTSHGSVSLTVDFKDDRVRFSVRDSGIGISDSDKGKLFISFSQLETGHQFGGAGLGLAISYKLVKAMGGELAFESAVGIGSCFSFSIEYKAAVDNGSFFKGGLKYIAEADSEITHFNQSRLLVIDDSISGRDHLSHLLIKAGFRDTHVSTVDKAVEVSRNGFFNVIILSIRLPGLKSISVAEEIQVLPEKRFQRMIAIVDNVASLLAIDGKGVGFCDFLVRPFKSEDLIEKVNFCLSFESAFSLSDTCESILKNSSYLRMEAVFEMAVSINDLLEVGDIDSIFKVANKFSEMNACGSYPNRIMNSCENLDISYIESFVALFVDTLNKSN